MFDVLASAALTSCRVLAVFSGELVQGYTKTGRVPGLQRYSTCPYTGKVEKLQLSGDEKTSSFAQPAQEVHGPPADHLFGGIGTFPHSNPSGQLVSR